MVPMVNDLDVRRVIRRGAKLYSADPGETIDVYHVDVPRLAAAGFSRVKGETPDGGPGDVEQGEKPLDARTVDELQEIARERNLEGRSTMTKAELVSALTPPDEE